MHLNCPACESSFVIDPVALGPSGRKVRCGGCGHAWHAEPDAAEAADQAPEPAIREGTGPDDPSAKLAAFDDPRQRSHAERRRPPPEGKRRAAAGGWILFALVVASLVAGVFFGRQQIMAWVPETAGLYAKVGLASADPAMVLELERSERRLVGGGQTLVIEGQIVNPTDRPQDVPPLVATLTDSGISWKPLPQTIEESERARLSAEPNGEGTSVLEGDEPYGLSSDAASLAESQSEIADAQSGGVSEASVAREHDAESGVPETQIAELAQTPPGSSEAAGEMANEPSVQAQSDEPVEQETAALSNGQAEEAETPVEEVTMESANATETGSSEAQGAAETPDMAARESFAAHLSSVRTRDGTKTEWQRLQDLFPKPLDGKKLTVRTIEVAEQGTFYRVMAGPFDDYDKAQDLCSQLKASDQYCVVQRLSEDPSQ